MPVSARLSARVSALVRHLSLPLLALALLALGSCDQLHRLNSTDYPRYDGTFVVFNRGESPGAIAYEGLFKFDYQRDAPGGVEKWFDKVIEEARDKGANGIIDCTKGTAFALWSISATGPRITGIMVRFADIDAAVKAKVDAKQRQQEEQEKLKQGQPDSAGVLK